MNDLIHTRSLLRELANHDDRQLQDIGLVRAEDGLLRLAADPEQLAEPMPTAIVTPTPALAATLARPFADALRNVVAAVRAVPFHSSASGPVILSPAA